MRFKESPTSTKVGDAALIGAAFACNALVIAFSPTGSGYPQWATMAFGTLWTQISAVTSVLLLRASAAVKTPSRPVSGLLLLLVTVPGSIFLGAYHSPNPLTLSLSSESVTLAHVAAWVYYPATMFILGALIIPTRLKRLFFAILLGALMLAFIVADFYSFAWLSEI